MRVLIIGGYGFIGREIAHHAARAGHDVVVLGRDERAARRLVPRAGWIRADLRDVPSQARWREWLRGIDAVVNAAGALQSSARDDVEAVHHRTVAELVRACSEYPIESFVQISAVGATFDARSEFLRSKSRGDDCVRASELPWRILKPGLVVGPSAYGGTALLRMLAGVPFVQPLALEHAKVQTVSMRDLVEIVIDALEGRLPPGTDVDVVEDRTRTLGNVIECLRDWLGVAPARIVLRVPGKSIRMFAKLGDALGLLGWRPPLRTTAVSALEAGVVGDPRPLAALRSRRPTRLEETLADLPSTLQDRWFSGLYLALPVVIFVLALFWILSGVIALIELESAASVSGLDGMVGTSAIALASLVDVGLGAAIMYRPWARRACWSMVVVATGYLVAGTVLQPELWVDPLGPFLKVIPMMMLCVLTAVLLEDR